MATHDHITRRSLVAGLAAAIPATAAAVPALSGADDNATINALWERWLALEEEAGRLGLAYDEAEALLPWWAKQGPEYLLHDGSHDGHVVGWPAIRNVTPPEPGIRRLIRPSADALTKQFRRELTIQGEQERDAITRRHRQRLRELALRRRAQREEYERVGLLAIEEQNEHNYKEQCAVEDAIEAMAPSLPRLAAMTLFEVAFQLHVDDTVEDRLNDPPLLHVALETARPALTGALAASVTEILSLPARTPVHGTFLWRGPAKLEAKLDRVAEQA